MIQNTVSDTIQTITLDRPAQRNALTPQMIDALIAAISACKSPARVLLLAANGPMFCSGFDLALCQQSQDGSVLRQLLRSLATAVKLLHELHCPVVIACPGGAIAGGCALLTAADYVVADQKAVFGYPVLRLGLSPAVSLPTLASMIGSGPARARALDVELVSAARAKELSLIHDVVAAPDLVQSAANSMASRFAAKPPEALTVTRQWLRQVAPLDEKAFAAGLEASIATAGTSEQVEMLERLLAARQKPKP